MTATPGRVLAGKYRLEQKLAAGGMGSVWRARHLDLEIDVAVKLIAEELVRTERAKARFQREARAAAQLKSPFVVRIFDYGLDDGTPYIVMELLEGEDLAARLETRRRILLEEAKD